MSSSTRITGESYSNDNDTLVTKVDDATLALTTMESTQLKDPHDDELKKPTTAVERNVQKESVVKNRDTFILEQPTLTEEPYISLYPETDNSAQPIINT